MISPQKATEVNKKLRLFSGMKPTGRIHIGNYFGALKQFVDLQDEYEEFIFIANLHAITGGPTKDELVVNTRELVLDYLAAGLDPERTVLFRQSDVIAHPALTWIFNCLITTSLLEQAHAYKDAQAKNKEINVGTFDYPVLMASDILLYDTDVVPVGKDQTQHVEYARKIANKFNNKYGTLFKFPKELVLEDTGVVLGTDGQKMSKSYNNTIPLSASDKEIEKAVMSIATDSRGKDDEKDPDQLLLYQIHKLFNPSAELKASYRRGLGYGDAKKMLVKDIITFLEPMRTRRKYYEEHPNLVEEILMKGAVKANEVAMEKLRKAYEAVGLVS